MIIQTEAISFNYNSEMGGRVSRQREIDSSSLVTIILLATDQAETYSKPASQKLAILEDQKLCSCLGRHST